VVSTEDEWQQRLAARMLDLRRHPAAGLEDLVEEAGPLGAARLGLREGRLHVAAVLDVDPCAGEALTEAGVANRRRAHVDAPPPGAEVESRSDDRNSLRRHGETIGGSLCLDVWVELVRSAGALLGSLAVSFRLLGLFLSHGFALLSSVGLGIGRLPKLAGFVPALLETTVSGAAAADDDDADQDDRRNDDQNDQPRFHG
jgi:hypothetical protein